MNDWKNLIDSLNESTKDTALSDTPSAADAGTLRPVEVILVLDRSGSMGIVRNATIEGVNTFIGEQSEGADGQRYLSVYLFNDDFEPLFEAKSIEQASCMDRETYAPHGCTALYDAVGEAIERTELRVSCCRDNPRVVLAVMTDGLENASRSYDAGKVRRMLERAKSNGWETFFLGASNRSLAEAREIGFEEDRGIRFALARTEIHASLRTINEKVQCLAAGRTGDELNFSEHERAKLAGDASQLAEQK